MAYRGNDDSVDDDDDADGGDVSQETLIVWSEGDNRDFGLSFEEKKGCDEVWEKICQVRLCVFTIR